MKHRILSLILTLIMLVTSLTACDLSWIEDIQNSSFLDELRKELEAEREYSVSLSEIPEFSGKPYVVINDNVPFFTEDELALEPFEEYDELDSLNRCGVTFACISPELMPTGDRGDIGSVYPSGWVQAKYDIVDGGYLYNRCHLIGFQLTAENANKRNLITGTRYMNVVGMLPFENMVADYIRETRDNVLYRVTPIFEGSNLVASGVLMEGMSVEDNGEDICFCVYVYNVQPGITIDYETGESWLSDKNASASVDFPETVTLCLAFPVQKLRNAQI